MEGSNITIGIAFLAGLASFLSPCVLPLVPGYISLMSGVSIDRLKDGGSRASARRAVIFNSLAFNAGLSIIFLALGATAGWLGSAILSNLWVRIAGGVVIILFGLHLIGLLKITALYRDTRKFSDEKPRGMLGSLTLGIAFAAGWTPCIGPILGGIIGLAATSGGWKGGLVLSAFYSAGLALPFLVTGLAINQFLGFYSKFRQHLHKVEVVSGVVLIMIGFLIASGYVTLLNTSLAAFIPNVENLIKPPPAATGRPPATTAANNSQPAPDVEFQTLDGKPFRLADLRGRVVLLNFWATWCGPCRAEIPEFNAMQRELKSQGLEVVGVSTSDSVDLIKEFQKDVSQEYTVLLGEGSLVETFSNGPGLPVTHIIDRDGRLREKFIGARDRAVFENAIKPLLSEAPTTARR
jgi:cytochrome c-type biogenesis protein